MIIYLFIISLIKYGLLLNHIAIKKFDFLYFADIVVNIFHSIDSGIIPTSRR